MRCRWANLIRRVRVSRAAHPRGPEREARLVDSRVADRVGAGIGSLGGWIGSLPTWANSLSGRPLTPRGKEEGKR